MSKPFIFTLMPFDESFDDIYKLGIKSVCEEEGAYCERVDEQIFQGSILDRIINQISKADIIIADMSGRSPNVFFEVGYAKALDKKLYYLPHHPKIYLLTLNITLILYTKVVFLILKNH